MADINSFVPSIGRLTFGLSPESAHDIPPGKSNSLFLFCPKQKAQHGNKCYEATDSYNLHSITPHFRLYRFMTLLLPGLFLVTMHDGIFKQGVKSLDRLYRIVSLRHRNSLYSANGVLSI